VIFDDISQNLRGGCFRNFTKCAA